MNILVTGGAGFIGSHLVDAYIEAGHRVAVLDDLSSGRRENVHPRAQFHQMDILHPDVKQLLLAERIDVINHHAAQASVERSVQNPLFDANSNIIGTLQLAQNALSCGVKKFIFASTGGAIYGNQPVMPVAEDAPPQPQSPYAISKLTAERYLAFFSACRQLNTVVLRYSNVYGPRQDPHGESGVIAIFCNKLARQESLVIFGDGLQTRDFMFVKDVVAANLKVLNAPATGVFNIGTGQEVSVSDLAARLSRQAGYNAAIEYGPARNGEQRRSAIDAAKFRKMFQWQPAYSLDQGLKETLCYFSNGK